MTKLEAIKRLQDTLGDIPDALLDKAAMAGLLRHMWSEAMLERGAIGFAVDETKCPEDILGAAIVYAPENRWKFDPFERPPDRQGYIDGALAERKRCAALVIQLRDEEDRNWTKATGGRLPSIRVSALDDAVGVIKEGAKPALCGDGNLWSANVRKLKP